MTFCFNHVCTPTVKTITCGKQPYIQQDYDYLILFLCFGVHKWIVSRCLWCYNHYPLDFIVSFLDRVIGQCIIERRR